MPDKITGSNGSKLALRTVEDLTAKTYAPAATPVMTSGGNGSATLNTGATAIVLTTQACSQVTIANNTGVDIEVQQGGSGAYFPVFAGTYYTFFGVKNANELRARRVDQSGTSVTLAYRWEA